ncbi:MAG TPA: carboxypeptidase regulatory-like domain-containing protein [Bryobacteraceae bacterium]|nr:carboxypeptidase regulatory-like domain-containing protein [Bryobacteraceae bacterium]
MAVGFQLVPVVCVSLLVCSVLPAQVSVTGRVVDETGAGIEGARVEFRPGVEGPPVPASSDQAGNFRLNLAVEGEYAIHAERQGFYVYQGRQSFGAGTSQLTITLNHVQEFSEKVDVTASAPPIDPQQPAEHKELVNAEIQAIPMPASQDYRNALALLDGVLLDNNGIPHFNGGAASQTNYTLDGFNMSDPVTGQLNTRLNVDSIQTTDLESSRFSAENGRGSAGVLDVKTKMGDDRWRFGATNFFPSISSDGGLHINKFTPRLEASGPIAKGKAWFYNGLDVFFHDDTIYGLPSGQNRVRGTDLNDLNRFQVNLTSANILTASFLYNLSDSNHNGLSALNPVETTLSQRRTLYMSTIRDEHYFGHGALFEAAFADSRSELRALPQGDQIFEITPTGDLGNYFVALQRHSYRQQWLGNLYLPTLHFLGTHQLKFGVDAEREAFHQQSLRHPYEVLDSAGDLERYVTFAGNPFEARKNFEGAEYVEDHWSPHEGLSLEGGLRAEWNEIVRALEWGPRLALAWAPGFLADTKFSAGWGIYYDAIDLNIVSQQQDQVSLSTFYLPGAIVEGPVVTQFEVYDKLLKAPLYQNASATVERKLPRQYYLKAGYTHRLGSRGFGFYPAVPVTENNFDQGVTYILENWRRERYDAAEISLRHTFAGKYEWFAGYTRSSARSNAAVVYSLENPVFGPQGPGPEPWDAPNRFHTWGWAPLPVAILPQRLRFITRNTSVAYLVEYRTGFPFSAVDQQGFMAGAPDSLRFPGYFNINLALERRFTAIHYLWAWRFGFNNLTNSLDPNVVNNVTGTPQYLTFTRGQARAFNVRLRFLGHR